MQVIEEFELSKDHTQIIKGKRTKRQRLPSPLRLAMPLASYNADTSYNNINENENSSRELALRDGTEEEEDMANCLILLAQGHHTPVPHHHHHNSFNKSSGLYIYQCKTCNRCFSSSQALGGHRASHSKLYKATEEKQAVTAVIVKEENCVDDHCDTTTNTILSLQIPNRATFSAAATTTKKSKVHECSICGAEFSSGQALGGHMRRHRTLVSTSTTTTTTTSMSGSGNMSPKYSQEGNKKPRNVLKLDLNLPAAPEDDQRESKFSFQPRENVIAFSRSSLVDCHY